ncbi:hypothetical protein [Priestia koreensis]|uniref:Uncharacterized protein n=1 Tax=Priestia koreensis TaxID=284581 RepID=A0A0M0LAP0_9BACI|nr:hypothetical protein [Priestia koreensis]KOO48170.1 hypothetical protein AMD01_05025 [Priestia koreensis]
MDYMLIWLNDPKQEEELVSAFHPLYKCEIGSPKSYLVLLEEKNPRYFIISSHIAKSLDLNKVDVHGTLIIIGETLDIQSRNQVVFHSTLAAVKTYIYTEEAASTPYEGEEEEILEPSPPAQISEHDSSKVMRTIEPTETTEPNHEKIEAVEKKDNADEPLQTEEKMKTDDDQSIEVDPTEERKEEEAQTLVNEVPKEQRVIRFNSAVKNRTSPSVEPTSSTDERGDLQNNEVLTHTAEEKPQDHQLNTLIKRTSEIRKEAFTKATWDENKVIGVWSPLHRIGVTSFIATFAMFLANERSQVGVLEAPSKAYYLKQLLERYKSIPDGWNSFARAIFDPSIPATSINYIYKGVQWIPLDEGDHELEWNTDALYHYVNSTRVFDFVLIDLPTGEIGEIYRPLLGQLDELWIIVDDSYLQIKGWKQYIDQMVKEYNLPSYLIFNKVEPFSQQEALSEDLELPLLAALPPLYQEWAKNQYENAPILANHSVFEKLEKPYMQLAAHVLGSADLTKHCSKYSLLGKWKRLFKKR